MLMIMQGKKRKLIQPPKWRWQLINWQYHGWICLHSGQPSIKCKAGSNLEKNCVRFSDFAISRNILKFYFSITLKEKILDRVLR